MEQKSSREDISGVAQRDGRSVIGINMQTADFASNQMSNRQTFSPNNDDVQNHRFTAEVRTTDETDRLCRKSSKESMLRQKPVDEQTIENDNFASNRNHEFTVGGEEERPEMALHQTYPFSAKVATALEPHILKETAFSDANMK